MSFRVVRDRRQPAERPSDTLERLAHADLTAMKVRQAEHGEQLRQHERVIDALEGHLGKMVDKFSRMEKVMLGMGFLIFSGSPQGTKVLQAVVGLIG